jgi:hypothetical protein
MHYGISLVRFGISVPSPCRHSGGKDYVMIKIFVNINEINSGKIVATVDISDIVVTDEIVIKESTIKYVVTIGQGTKICKYNDDQLTSTEYFPDNAGTLPGAVASMGRSVNDLTRIVAQVIMRNDYYIEMREQDG